MYNFLVEFRFHGYPRKYTKKIILDISRKYRVKGVTRRRVVPHISLYVPATTDNINRVVSEVEIIARKYTLVPFKIEGFRYFNKGNKVIYLNVIPSPHLEELRWELSQRLCKISTPQPWDRQRKFQFHATVAFKDIDRKFRQIWAYIKEKEEPNINQHLLRITIIGRRSKILYEYDLVLKKLLNRRKALSRYWWRKTIAEFRKLKGLPMESRQHFIIRWLQRMAVIFGK